jgi:1-acyl-sn-glycerol-3-phosphate acyltransferase
LRLAVKPYVKVIYRNLESQTDKPVIFICNHRSASDPYLMALLNTELVQIVNRWPFKIPFYGYFAKKAEYISIHDIDYEKLQTECSNLIRDGISIAAFPEGTRSGNSKVGSFNSSMFRIAIENKCPISPVCIIGNEKIPSRNFSITPGKIVVYRLKSITWNEYKDKSVFQLKNYVRNIIIKETEKMECQQKNV